MGFAAGDTNLFRFVGNSPTNATDPSGLQKLPTAPAPRPTWVAPEPRAVSEGEGEPPDYRSLTAPAISYNGKVYRTPNPARTNWDQVIVGFTNVIVFKNQRTTLPNGTTIVEDVEVRAWGTRRFPTKATTFDGDHIAYVVMQLRFINRSLHFMCFDEQNEVVPLPNRWKQIEFSLNHSVFLRSTQPPALDTVMKKFVVNKDDTWDTFVERFIATAKAIKEPGK